MVREKGVIERITGKKAMVRIQKSSACSACEAKDSCDVTSGKGMTIEVVNELMASEGDVVEISISSRSFLKLTVLVYFVPVAALIICAYFGEALGARLGFNTSVASILTGGMGMGVTFFILRRFDQDQRKKRSLSPKMTRILLG
jgi:sigma-E factor negative regulatory protein RseC